MNITFDEKAIDCLEKLPKDTGARILLKIISTKKNPFHFFERLSGSRNYKLRIGDYRVIADIDKDIRIIFIGHRKNVYGQTQP
ncbi:type II toxin-antitoxin system RelE/ParE family toxin [Thermoproteota archaeon]